MIDKPRHLPASTYRVQLSPGFGFNQAKDLVPYLSALGITDCYVSPILAPRPGSTHGYDVCDHNKLNPALGTDEEFRAFCIALQERSMGLVLDFVPNHMGVDPQANLQWRSVLENGPSSPFANFFDIDWTPVKAELRNKVLLPVLGDQYGNVLESGKLQICFEDGSFSLQYADLDFPLNPRQARLVLTHRLDHLRESAGDGNAELRELLSILFHLDHIPPFFETAPEMVEERDREKSIATQRLAALVASSQRIRDHVENNIREFNGTVGSPHSFDLLHKLLDEQPYRLSYWTTAVHEINYRRFFDINELAGIRMEDAAVFHATHTLLRDLTQQKMVTGLRLDHVDGLFNPRQYFADLQEFCAPEDGPLYVVVEKILSEGESLRTDWDIHGTTGYEYLNDVAGVFVDPAGGASLRKLYGRFAGRSDRFADLVYESKKLIVATSMASELNLLAHELNRISESDRRYRDFTLDSLQEGLREVVACFPVYRSYITLEGHDGYDKSVVDAAVADALRRNPVLEPSMFAFIRSMLLPVKTAEIPKEDYERRVKFAMKFQQYTGPVQAKGVEDTAFYRYAPLISLNEVGGEPARFGRTVDEFHLANRRRREYWPLSILSTATHDTKRGEDARCRISVLSEIPEEFRRALFRWARANAGLKRTVRDIQAPDRADEYLYYQSLLGAWPADLQELPGADFIDRMRNYMRKAIKEEKIHSSWIHPNVEYDEAVSEFVRRTLSGAEGRRFLRVFLPFQQRIARAGMVNSFAQLILKIMSPGVPDFYQGAELWDLNLVDPDNRRPVDFALRSSMLKEIEPLLSENTGPEHRIDLLHSLLRDWQNGKLKLACTARVLNLRRRLRDLFLYGDYVPLAAHGEKGQHVIAVGRQHGPDVVMAIVPRLAARLSSDESPIPVGPGCWQDTAIELDPPFQDRHYRDLFTAEKSHVKDHLYVGAAFDHLPFAIFVAQNHSNDVR